MTLGHSARHTLVLPVDPDAPSLDAIERAAQILREGGLVAFPTETVYGLGADATNASAVAGIFAAKGRPYSDPLIVHLSDADALDTVTVDAPAIARLLSEHFWPGPLTLILPRGACIPAIVSAGGSTIGVRVPDHPIARALIRAAGVPIAAPSANRFMYTSPTTATHVLADLDGRIDCVLDGGPTPVGVESTVLDVTVAPPRILRPGGVTLEALRAFVPDVVAPRPHAEISPPETAVVLRAPGQLDRHYAPRAHLIVFDAQGLPALDAMRAEAVRALAEGKNVGAIVLDEEVDLLADLSVTIAPLGPGRDLAEVSRRLYAALRSLDERHVDVVLAHTFGTAGLGLALWDRLRRAAGGVLRPA